MKYPALFSAGGLSLDRLNSLVEMDDAGSFAAAAPNDRGRQSQLCRQVGELEKFFDITLKCMEGRTARLNEDGKQLAALAREHLQSLEDFKRTTDKRPITVSLAAGGALHEWVVLPRLKQLREAAGAVIWQLFTRKNAVMWQQLIDGSLDFALLRSDLLEKYEEAGENGKRNWKKKATLAGTSLGTLGYSVFVPDAVCPRVRDLPLKKILAELPIATQGNDTLFQLRLETAVAKLKWKMSPVFYGESFTHVAQAVGSGTMAGILPDIAAAAFDPARVWRAPLKEFGELRRKISLAWNPARHARLSVLEKLQPVVERVLRFE